MKKIILIAVVMVGVLSAGKSFGQVTRTVNLNITLSTILEMTVNQDGYLTMDFNTPAKYTNGIEFDALNQIVVKSNKGYLVTAQEGSITGGSSLPSGSVQITPSLAAGQGGDTHNFGTFVTTTLDNANKAIISKGSGSFSTTNDSNVFTVKYKVGADGLFVNKTAATGNIIPILYTVTQP